jgi:hypothetical protein
MDQGGERWLPAYDQFYGILICMQQSISGCTPLVLVRWTAMQGQAPSSTVPRQAVETLHAWATLGAHGMFVRVQPLWDAAPIGTHARTCSGVALLQQCVAT